jgi:hypothetical protein
MRVDTVSLVPERLILSKALVPNDACWDKLTGLRCSALLVLCAGQSAKVSAELRHLSGLELVLVAILSAVNPYHKSSDIFVLIPTG